MTNINQDKIFAEFEGDQWFERNRAALEQYDLENDLPLRVIQLYHLRPRKVLEVGGANGFRLAAIRERYAAARLVVVEPSGEAIRNGRERYPFIEFIQGLASEIPLEETFDLIITNFIFCWIDRSSLLRSVAEVDRLLEEAGFLIIGDFSPSRPTKVSYHHLPDKQVWTYKQNYAAPFLASGLYQLVCALTGGHSPRGLLADVPETERIGVLLLKKT